MSLSQCPVCDLGLDAASLSTVELATLRGHQDWARCPRCRSFFALADYDPALETAHTRTRPWGALQTALALNDDRAPMFDAVLRLIRRYAEPGSTLLDVGCSYGGFLQKAQSEGYDVRGIDIVPEAVEYVRSLGIACERAASVEHSRLPENSLDIVSVLDCNYYWPNQGKELRLIHSLLKAGGLLAMRTVDTSAMLQTGIWLRAFLPGPGRRLSEYAVYDHRVVVPIRALLQVVRQQGFEIVYASPRAALPLRRNSWRIRIAYAVGELSWRIARYNLAPGFVILARKQRP
jgi:SAM-dependent methyltransferase